MQRTERFTERIERLAATIAFIRLVDTTTHTSTTAATAAAAADDDDNDDDTSNWYVRQLLRSSEPSLQSGVPSHHVLHGLQRPSLTHWYSVTASQSADTTTTTTTTTTKGAYSSSLEPVSELRSIT